MTLYTVTATKKMKTVKAGHEWEDSLPDSLFVAKYNFDGHEFGPVGSKDSEFTLFWYPKLQRNAIELLKLLDKRGLTVTLEVRP